LATILLAKPTLAASMAALLQSTSRRPPTMERLGAHLRSRFPALTGGLTDKPWLEIDTNPASKFKNSLYISITQFDANSDSQITLTYSHNGGKTWNLGFTGPLQTFPQSVDQFSDITIGADITTGWSEPVPGRELHPLKSSAFSRRTVTPTDVRRAENLRESFYLSAFG
jgi:hypothetical protein